MILVIKFGLTTVPDYSARIRESISIHRRFPCLENPLISLIGTIASLLFFSTSVLADLVLSEGGPSGQLFNPERNGEGFYIEIIVGPPMQIGVAMYSYDADGDQLWVVGNVPIDAGDQIAEIPVFEFDGPAWDPGYDPGDLNTIPFGTITTQFPTCDTAWFSVKPDGPLQDFNYSLLRLTSVEGAGCTEPPDPPGGLTPGHWAGDGVCFMVSDDGLRIQGGDLSECDQQASFDSNLEGITNLGDECNVNVGCEGPWEIIDGKFNCVNELGELAVGIFGSDTSASGQAFEEAAGEGEICRAVWTASPVTN